MSIPSSFESSKTYFEAVSKFLSTYSWIYRKANTDCIPSIDSMPLEFKSYFLGISNEKLNLFPIIHEKLTDCPSSLLSFRQELNTLTPKDNACSLNSSHCIVSNRVGNQKGISAKKILEITRLSKHVYDHCEESQILVDLGAGLGYLSHALYELKPNYLILGLEVDKTRVEKARQRCVRFLPPEATKSIIYQQHFINVNSSTYINTLTSELAVNNGCLEVKTISIIGLHACADLSINAMRLFLNMPQVRCLHIMPCCYHKLELTADVIGDSDHRLFTNFPLSDALRKSIETTNIITFLNRPFLRLACQQTRSHWEPDRTVDAHEEHGYRMYIRALAEAVLQTTELVKPIKKISHIYPINFVQIKEGFQLISKESGASMEWNSTHEAKFLELCLKYPDSQGPRLAEALTCLQTSMQKLCENVVLFDRLCYLKEMAAMQNILIKVRYDTILDEKISPRCQVLVAEKCGP